MMPTRPLPSLRCDHPIKQPACACCTAEVRAITRRVDHDLSRRGFLVGSSASVASLGLAAFAAPAQAQASPARPVLFRNARVFNGLDANTQPGMSVLLQGDSIAEIASGPLAPPEGTLVIDASGRTLMPGLIDAHWHTMLAALPVARMLTAEVGDIHLAAAAQATRTLMRGFTTVRDMGGPAFALKRAIDSGIVVGPRIYASGAIISQTSGHGDFRSVWELPGGRGLLSRAEMLGAAALTDGRSAVLRATREQLMGGASQIKIVAGGGVASAYDPIDVIQFLPEEIEAAVAAAADWGTYVAAHVYTPEGIKRCIRAGVRTIEHGQLADEDAVRMMADRGVVWSLQPFLEALHGSVERIPPATLEKWKLVWAGTDASYAMAQRHRIPTGFGTDLLFDQDGAEQQGKWLAGTRRWFTPAQALKQATADNAAILRLSGPRNHYPRALGVVQRSAHADLLLVEGDPTENLDLVADPDANFRVIMKGGRVYKNTL
jgi:imidazolonepropionase-like amidohydrolase